MGAKSGFTNTVQRLFDAIPPDKLASIVRAIDGSYVLHQVTRMDNLGYEMFRLRPGDNLAVRRVVQMAVRLMLVFLAAFGINPQNTVWFFEGRIAKWRHSSMSAKRNGRLSRHLRLMFRKRKKYQSAYHDKRIKRQISNAYGRPPPWLTVLIAGELKTMGYVVDYSNTIESDFRICQFAAAWKSGTVVVMDGKSEATKILNSGLSEVVVVGSDSDFIALSPPGSVDGIAKMSKGAAICLDKNAVLKDKDTDEFTMLLAYCTGGCCNMLTHVNGYGWVKSFNFAVESGITRRSIKSLQKLPLKGADEAEAIAMANEIRDILQNFGWNSPRKSKFNCKIESAPKETKSEMQLFAEATDNEGFFVRPAIYRMVIGKAPDPKKVRPQRIGKPQTAKGTIAPKIPGMRPIPANRFFVLREFMDLAEKGYSKQWADGDEDEDEDGDACHSGAGKAADGSSAKKKKRKNGKRNGKQQTVDAQAQAEKVNSDTSNAKDKSKSSAAEVATTVTAKKTAKQKPYKSPSRKPAAAKTVAAANERKERKKASEMAKYGNIDPVFGRATVPKPDRMSLSKRYTVRSFCLPLRKQIKMAVRGMSSKYGRGINENLLAKAIDDGINEMTAHAQILQCLAQLGLLAYMLNIVPRQIACKTEDDSGKLLQELNYVFSDLQSLFNQLLRRSADLREAQPAIESGSAVKIPITGQSVSGNPERRDLAVTLPQSSLAQLRSAQSTPLVNFPITRPMNFGSAFCGSTGSNLQQVTDSAITFLQSAELTNLDKNRQSSLLQSIALMVDSADAKRKLEAFPRSTNKRQRPCSTNKRQQTGKQEALEYAVTYAVQSIRSNQLDPIDISDMPQFLTQLAAEQKKNLTNHIACLDELKWKALKSIKGFKPSASATLTQSQREQLLKRGLQNAAEIFPNLANDSSLRNKIVDKLEDAIDQLRAGASENRQKAIEHIGPLFGLDWSSDDKFKPLVEAIDRQVNNKERKAFTVYRSLQAATKKCKQEFTDEVKKKLEEAAALISTGNEDKRSVGERILSFLWCNLLLPKSSRYAVSPLSGFKTGFVAITMQALDRYLERNKDYRAAKKIVMDFENSQQNALQPQESLFGPDFNSNNVAYLRRFVVNPDRQLKSQLKSNKMITIPTIRTDGYQVALSFIDLRQPKAFQVNFLAKQKLESEVSESVEADELQNEGTVDEESARGTPVDDDGDIEADSDYSDIEADSDYIELYDYFDEDFDEYQEDIDEEHEDVGCHEEDCECDECSDEDGEPDGDDIGDDDPKGGDGDDPGGGGDDDDGGPAESNGQVGEEDESTNNNSKQRPGDRLTEISRYLAKTPARAGQIRTIMAVDEGILFPIAATVIQMPAGEPVTENSKGVKRHMRVKKECLYQPENEQASRLELRKSKRTDVIQAEAALGASKSKSSLNWQVFKNGYYQAWLTHHKTLFRFYGLRAHRADRMRCTMERQRLYDKLVNQLFEMMGVALQYSDGSRVASWKNKINRDKLVVLGQQQLSTEHKGQRPSKHAAFWHYFIRKAVPLGVDVVGLTEFRSSKVCMWCCKKIKHDKEKNYRVYYCATCKRHAHRDGASSEIHCMIAWSEIVGYIKAAGELEPYDPDKSETVKYFRPRLFQPKWMRPTVSKNDIKDPLAKGSA